MRVVVLLSGGLDSTVLLAHLRTSWHDCQALSVGYGQKHARELLAAAAVARKFKVPHEIVQLPPGFLRGSALTGDAPVPQGHYADSIMRQTIVPARNTVLLSLAAAMAVRDGANAVAYAAHAGDQAIYPDCQPAFIDAMRLVLQHCAEKPLKLLAPFASLAKKEILEIGIRDQAPLELTWSCYEGREQPCGLCGACVERMEAFALAGALDPIQPEAP